MKAVQYIMAALITMFGACLICLASAPIFIFLIPVQFSLLQLVFIVAGAVSLFILGCLTVIVGLCIGSDEK